MLTTVCSPVYSGTWTFGSLEVSTARSILNVFGMIFGRAPVVPKEWNNAARLSRPTGEMSWIPEDQPAASIAIRGGNHARQISLLK